MKYARKIQIDLVICFSVGKGVTCFKEDKSVEAMQHFNTALEIDAECVEGLVARGALLAFKIIASNPFSAGLA